MAYEYDRLEREDGGGSFLMGLLAGTVLGAGLGMLFAPKAGSELRNQLGEQAGQLQTQATEKVSQIVDRGREAYDRARSNVGTSTGSTGSSTMPSSSQTGSLSGAGTGSYSTNRG